jgi:hypothetical protein
MQTPTKYTFGILVVLAMIGATNLGVAAPPHSESSVGQFTLGIAGAPISDACVDNTFQGVDSTCSAVFPEEQGFFMVFVGNGIVADLRTATSPIPFLFSNACLNDATATVTGTAAGVPGAATTIAGDEPAFAGDQNPNPIENAVFGATKVYANNCPDAFTKSAQRLHLDVTFYDALGVPIPTEKHYLPTAYNQVIGSANNDPTLPGCTTWGSHTNNTGAGGVQGDLVALVPSGATTMSVTAGSLTSVPPTVAGNVAWWSFIPCNYY